MCTFFVRGVETVSELRISLRRLDGFLSLPEPPPPAGAGAGAGMGGGAPSGAPDVTVRGARVRPYRTARGMPGSDCSRGKGGAPERLPNKGALWPGRAMPSDRLFAPDNELPGSLLVAIARCWVRALYMALALAHRRARRSCCAAPTLTGTTGPAWRRTSWRPSGRPPSIRASPPWPRARSRCCGAARALPPQSLPRTPARRTRRPRRTSTALQAASRRQTAASHGMAAAAAAG